MLPELDVSDEPDVPGVDDVPLLDVPAAPEEPAVSEPDVPAPDELELGELELPVPDEPDVPESFFSVSVAPGLVVSAPVVPPVVPEADPAPEVESVEPVEEEPDPPASEPVVPVPVELGLGVVELGVLESVALDDGVLPVVPVVPLLPSSALSHPANSTLKIPAASKTFVVCIVDLIILFLSQKLSTHCLDCIGQDKFRNFSI